MILDSSAVVGLLLRDGNHEALEANVERADLLAIGAPTLVETGIVMIRKLDLSGRALVSQFLEACEVVVTPFDDRHWRVAAEAFVRYGKGRHPAALNYGDCMSYATARVAGLPLLFTGNDFSRTDITPA